MIDTKALLTSIRKFRDKYGPELRNDKFADSALRFVESQIRYADKSCNGCKHYNRTNCVANCGYCTKFNSAMRDGDCCTEHEVIRNET